MSKHSIGERPVVFATPKSCSPTKESTLRYLCLVYFDEADLAALSKSEDKQLTQESMAYDEELKARGHLVVAHALHAVRTATTVQVRGGKLSATDGPFAETKEQLGGFILIEASDLNEAIQLAAGIPLAKTGRIEVRRVRSFEAAEA